MARFASLCVRERLRDRGEISEEEMTLVLDGLPEQTVSAVEAIQNTHHTKVLVEPVTENKWLIINSGVGDHQHL